MAKPITPQAIITSITPTLKRMSTKKAHRLMMMSFGLGSLFATSIRYFESAIQNRG